MPDNSKRNSLAVRLYFFTNYAAVGSLIPFISLFYRFHGLSGTEIGLLSTVGAIFGLMAAPLWGRWSDRVQDSRRLLQAASIGTAVCMLLLSRQTLFVWFALIVALDSLLAAGIDPISSALAIAIARTRSRLGFGSIRLWGSLGWAVLAPISGWIIEQTSLNSMFLLYAGGMVISVGIINLITSRAEIPQENSSSDRQPLGKLVGALLKRKPMLGLTFALVITWMANTGIYNFEAIYLHQLGAGESMIGMVNSFGALIELPAMLWADRLLHRFGSARILPASFLLQAVSMVFVIVHPSILAIFATRLILAISFSFFTIASVVYIVENAPVQGSTTTLALYNVTLSNLTRIISAPLSGMVFDLAGAYWLYVIAMVGNLLGWIILKLTAEPARINRIPPSADQNP